MSKASKKSPTIDSDGTVHLVPTDLTKVNMRQIIAELGGKSQQVYGHWYGGTSWSHMHANEYETWNSLEAAKEALLARYESRGPHRVELHRHEPDGTVSSCVEHWETPCVSEDCQMLLWVGKPDPDDFFPCDDANNYPKWLLVLNETYDGVEVQSV